MEINIVENSDKSNHKIVISLKQNSYFSITATFWKIGKPRIDKFFDRGGCSHDEILKIRPDLKIFVDLHLSDIDGVPMYAIENGYYHLKNSHKELARYYIRASKADFDIISEATSQFHFSKLLFMVKFVTLNQY